MLCTLLGEMICFDKCEKTEMAALSNCRMQKFKS